MPITCKVCGSRAYSEYCFRHKPRKPIKPVSTKQATSMAGMKKRWFKANPANANGNWICYLQITPECPRILTRETLTLEHVHSKVRRPDLKFDENNVEASCSFCNKEKASQSIEELSVNHRHLQEYLTK